MNASPDAELLIGRFVRHLGDYAIIMLDADGRILSWNAGAEQMKGYAADEILGEHFSVFYTPEALAVGHPERELANAVATGKFSEAGWRVRKDGTRLWAHVVIIALSDADGGLLGFGKIVCDGTESKQATEQMMNVTALLETTSRTDFLTGLDNRRSLDTIMDGIMASAHRHHRPVVLAMLDLDKFKAFNDQHGHQNGDRYLRKAAVAWRRELRREDVLARYGGEEFTAVMPDTTLATAISALNRLRLATPAPLTCSIGVAEWDGAEDANALIDRADRLLYVAKKAGRNRIEVWPALTLVAVAPKQAARPGVTGQTGAGEAG